jgi:hypothetical protein
MPTLEDNSLPRVLLPSAKLQHNTDMTSESSWNECETFTPDTSFAFTHSTMYHTVEQWYQETSAKAHSFYALWTRAKFLGLTATTTWDEISTILKLHNYGDYIHFITKCPKITQEYKLDWDTSNDIICHEQLQYPTPQHGAQELNHMSHYYQKMQHMAHIFESKYHDLTNKMDNINAQITYCEHLVRNQADKGNRLITTHTNNQLQSMLNTALQRTTQFTSDLATAIEHHTNIFQSNISNITVSTKHQIDTKLKEINSHFDHKIKEFNLQLTPMGRQKLQMHCGTLAWTSSTSPMIHPHHPANDAQGRFSDFPISNTNHLTLN